jgi:ferredoxin
MSHKRQGYRFENDWGIDVLEDDAKSIAAGVALPIYQEIKENNTVLNLDNVKKYLLRSKKIALTNCACRTKRKHCDAPVDVCLSLNAAAENFLAKGYVQTAGGMRQPVREVTIEQALEAVTRAHEAGLVPMAYIRMDSPEPHDPSFICNCCSCCCAELGLTLRFGMAPHILKSLAISANDVSKCMSCGKCVDRCHFGARKMVDDKMVYNKDLCFGCGLCVSTCPTNAIKLIKLT